MQSTSQLLVGIAIVRKLTSSTYCPKSTSLASDALGLDWSRLGDLPACLPGITISGADKRLGPLLSPGKEWKVHVAFGERCRVRIALSFLISLRDLILHWETYLEHTAVLLY